MLARASRIKSTQPTFTDHVTFLKANITSIPLPPDTANCIISNCVINPVPHRDKPPVFREIYRLLKPGGRVAVSGIPAKKMPPERLVADIAIYMRCIAGASELGEYKRWSKREDSLVKFSVVSAR
ncbi:hypothetical protein RB595_003445 [Gaeumannomyces hyphopodioides]